MSSKKPANSADAYRGKIFAAEKPEVLTDTRPIPSAPMLAKPADKLRDIDISKIIPDPIQARKVFQGIDELAESIKLKGVITPLIVSRVETPDSLKEDRYNLVAGERRLRAAALADLKKVPCVIKAKTISQDEDEIGFIENVHRKDLTFIEFCMAIRDIIDRKGYTQREFAARIIIPESTVSEALKTAAFALKYLERYGDLGALYNAATSDGRPLGRTHFREITGEPTFESQVALFQKVVSESLSVRKISAVTNKTRTPRNWNATRYIKHLKSLRKNTDAEILQRIDSSPDSERVLTELETTYNHVSGYLDALKNSIGRLKDNQTE